MLDLKFVRENPDIVKQNIKNKFQDRKLPLVDEVIELDAQARATKTEADELRANVLVPFIRDMFHRQVGHSILAAGIVLAIMIFPTITSVSADAIRSVPKDYRMGAYGMGSTRWQTIYKIVLPASASGIFSGIILGLARAFGEALAVAMVIGQTTALPDSIFSTTKSLTTEITAQMGNAMEGGETKTALWTLALLLFLISLLFIFLIHFLSAKQSEESGNKKKGAKTN